MEPSVDDFSSPADVLLQLWHQSHKVTPARRERRRSSGYAHGGQEGFPSGKGLGRTNGLATTPCVGEDMSSEEDISDGEDGQEGEENIDIRDGREEREERRE